MILDWVKIAQEKEKLLQQQEQIAQDVALKIQTHIQAKKAVELENQSLQSTVQFNKAYIKKLKLELANLKRVRFGSKSEAFNSPQGKLFEELHDIAIDILAQEIKKLSQAYTKQDAGNSPTQKKPSRQCEGRQVLPAH